MNDNKTELTLNILKEIQQADERYTATLRQLDEMLAKNKPVTLRRDGNQWPWVRRPRRWSGSGYGWR